MSTTPTPTPDSKDPKKPMNEWDLLQSVGGPSREQIDVLKQSVPNGRVRLFTPDGKRA